MPRSSPSRTAQSAAERTNLYDEITGRIIAVLEAGRLPWVQPWGTSGVAASLSMPRNAATGRGYSGINVLILWSAVVYADRFVPDDEKRRARDWRRRPGDPVPKALHRLLGRPVRGLPDDLVTVPPPIVEGLILPEVEALIRASGAVLRIGGDQAFYSPGLDCVQVSRPDAYFEPINWHRTALDELGHWTGHASRLDRDLSHARGSAGYA